jgi:hypothetical protein
VPTIRQWEAWGQIALTEVLREQHAVTWAEAQARISDRPHPSVHRPIQPHVATRARASLMAAGKIVEARAATRGGTEIAVLHLSDTKGRSRAIADAAARKRLLTARYRSWATATPKYPQGLIGGAGERVVERSIEAASPYGLRFAAEKGGEVRFLLGDLVEGGALDGAVWADVSDERGRIQESILCPIEVKNIRHWIYPRHWELFQLLYKAAKLQERLDDVDICPVMITRNKSIWTNDMSRALGFRVIDVNRQFVLPVSEVPEAHFEAVREELGYADLVRTDGPHERVVHPLRSSLARSAKANADQWRAVGSNLATFYGALRDRDLDQETRTQTLQDLGDAALKLDERLDVDWAGGSDHLDEHHE